MVAKRPLRGVAHVTVENQCTMSGIPRLHRDKYNDNGNCEEDEQRPTHPFARILPNFLRLPQILLPLRDVLLCATHLQGREMSMEEARKGIARQDVELPASAPKRTVCHPVDGLVEEGAEAAKQRQAGRARLRLDVVDHDALLLDKHCHVREHLAQLHQALVERLDSLMTLIDIVQCV